MKFLTATLRFLVATLELSFLFLIVLVANIASDEVAIGLAVAVLSIGLIGLFRRLPRLRVGSRGKAVAVSVLGVLLLIATIGGRYAAQQAAELAHLRETNTVVYLARLEECCKTRWVKEVEVLDPAAYQAWLREEAARQAEEQRLEAARAEEERLAKVADILKAIRAGDWAAADNALGRRRGGDLTAAYDEIEAVALSVVKPLPARDLPGNQKGYAFLSKLRPDNAVYREKAEHYATRLKAAEERAEQEAERARDAEAERRAAEEEAEEFSAALSNRTKQNVWIEVTKDGVRDRLRDPGSAEFRNVEFHAYKGKTPVVCGQVNAKNSFGAYIGYQGFIGSGDVLVFLETEMEAGEFVKAWNEMCFE